MARPSPNILKGPRREAEALETRNVSAARLGQMCRRRPLDRLNSSFAVRVRDSEGQARAERGASAWNLETVVVLLGVGFAFGGLKLLLAL